jgi:DNA topoisomerase-3
MTAILAEKPSVAKDVARVLGVNGKKDGYMEGNGYLVTWAFGHLAVLAPPETYGITKIPVIPHQFKPVARREKTANGYQPDSAALKQLKVIKSVFDKCDSIIVATDAAREGELIFRNIFKLLECEKPFSRLWISSLTDKAISDGFARLKPGADFDSLYFAAESRAYADWLVGINGSRALSMITGDKNHSPGRVQTPALAMVCARYEENRNFKPQLYWIFKTGIEKDGVSFHLTAKEKFFDKSQAGDFYRRLEQDATIRITKAEKKETAQEPPLLYDLSALQQDANRRHGFSAEQTLNIAQKLYEAKLISYPRTGSRYISEDVFAEVPHLIKSLENHPLFGRYVQTMVAAVPNVLNTRSVDDQKVSDHHALIVTGNQPEKPGKEEQTVYDMIAGRMLEAFSEKCVRDILVIQAESDGGIQFETRGGNVRLPGWRGVFNHAEEKPEDEETKALPALSEGERFTAFCSNMVGKQTKSKPLFTEGSLLAAMERAGSDCEMDENSGNSNKMPAAGIGTPATRAAIIETLFKRGYMERDKKNLIPTERGLHLYHAVKNLQIADAGLTVEWEAKLAKIEKEPAFRDVFMAEIKEYTQKVVDEISSLQITDNSQKLTCPKCKTGVFAMYAKVAKCGNAACNLTIFKSICGKNLTDKHVEEPVKNGKTGLIKGFKGKNDSSFDASLKFDEAFKVAFVFAKNAKPKKK